VYRSIASIRSQIKVSDTPSQSIYVALRESLYLLNAQAMMPPTKFRPGMENMGSSHQAQETCSWASSSLCSPEPSAPQLGQNTASLRIAPWQALQEYKGFEQYWQKLPLGVDLPHVGQLTLSAILGSRIQ